MEKLEQRTRCLRPHVTGSIPAGGGIAAGPGVSAGVGAQLHADSASALG
jgi:hypothetical protein